MVVPDRAGSLDPGQQRQVLVLLWVQWSVLSPLSHLEWG